MIVSTINMHIIGMKSDELENCFIDFSLIKLNVLQSEGKIWLTDLHFNVLTINNYVIYWQNITFVM